MTRTLLALFVLLALVLAVRSALPPGARVVDTLKAPFDLRSQP